MGPKLATIEHEDQETVSQLGPPLTNHMISVEINNSVVDAFINLPPSTLPPSSLSPTAALAGKAPLTGTCMTEAHRHLFLLCTFLFTKYLYLSSSTTTICAIVKFARNFTKSSTPLILKSHVRLRRPIVVALKDQHMVSHSRFLRLSPLFNATLITGRYDWVSGSSCVMYLS